MGSRYILSKVPKHTQVYIFGSALTSSHPNDLDILVIYDSDVYPMAEIYEHCKAFIKSLFKQFKLNVDATYLSINEAKSVSFIEKVGAKPLESQLNYLYFSLNASERMIP